MEQPIGTSRLLAWVTWMSLALPPAGWPAGPAQSPAAFSARYQLSRDDVSVGETLVTLEHLADGGYRYAARTEPNGLVSLIRNDVILEESRGRLEQGRPRPDRYTYHRTGGDLERRLTLDFDWRRRQVRISETSSAWTLDIPEGTLDKLVQQLTASRDLGTGVRRTEYRVADGGLLKDYRYQVTAREFLDTRLGRLETLRVDRSKSHGPHDYTLWLAPRLDHLPVRIVRRHGDSLYRMDLVELERPDG